jgi:transaldolase
VQRQREKGEVTMTALKLWKRHRIVAVDPGDIEGVNQHNPQDWTTNPPLIYQRAGTASSERTLAKAAEISKGIRKYQRRDRQARTIRPGQSRKDDGRLSAAPHYLI